MITRDKDKIKLGNTNCLLCRRSRKKGVILAMQYFDDAQLVHK